MIYSPSFNGIFNLQEYDRLRSKLSFVINEVCFHGAEIDDLEINIDFLRSEHEIHAYFKNVFMFCVDHDWKKVAEYIHPQWLRSKSLFVSSKDKEKIKWAQHHIYNTLMEKCAIIADTQKAGLFRKEKTLYKLKITKHI